MTLPIPEPDENVVQLQAPERGVTEQVYARLLAGIERRDYRPGRQMDERGLAEAMSVSRTPLRNALSRLLGEGYLERLPNSSLAVRAISAGEVLDLLFVRRLLEPEAAAQAAGRLAIDAALVLRRELADIAADESLLPWRLGDRLHDLVVEHCRNPSLARIVIDARRRIHMSSLEEAPGRRDVARDEHIAILDALVRGDPEEARTAMATHLDNSRASFLAGLGIGR